MAALFLLALGLIVWQAVRSEPPVMAPLSFAWTGGEQAFPIAAPFWTDPVDLPAGRVERYRALLRRSVLWPGAAAGGACESFIRTSASTWVRRGVDPGLLPPEPEGGEPLHYAARDFLDDDDGDGDALDAGELIPGGTGAEVAVFCPPPSADEAAP